MLRRMAITDDPTGTQHVRSAAPALCVLASSSSGNCSVLVYGVGGRRRALLIDLGLSPKRTLHCLSHLGLDWSDVDGALLTHLDADHLHSSWRAGGGAPMEVAVHACHERALADQAPSLRRRVFDGRVLAGGGVEAWGHVAVHDQEGVVAFRIGCDGGTLGYATDVGRVDDHLVAHLAGVDVLAIESNYCPELQRASGRPAFLKARIMNGAGHLSNREATDAVRRIGPRHHVVLLHLSRQCNTPDRAAAEHEGADYALTIAAPDRPSRWVRLRAPCPVSAVRIACAGVGGPALPCVS